MEKLDDFILQLADGDPSGDSGRKQDGDAHGDGSTSRQSLKRSQSFISESDDEQDSDYDLEDMDEFGYFGEADRKRLEALPEVERERILAEREEKRQSHRERLELRRMLDNSKDEPVRRSRTNTSTKQALSELTRRREEKYKNRSQRGSVSDRAKRQRHSYSGESDYEEYSEEEGYDSEELKERKAKKRLPTLDELRSVSLTRHMIERWIHSPFFDQLAAGAFVRISIGVDPHTNASTYRLCEVVEVVPYDRSYKVSENVWSKSALLVKHGKAERRFRMDFVSNQPVQQNEFDRFVKTLQAEHCRMPSMDKVEQKREDIKHAHDYVLTEHEVTEMIKKKHIARNIPLEDPAEQFIRAWANDENQTDEPNEWGDRTSSYANDAAPIIQRQSKTQQPKGDSRLEAALRKLQISLQGEQKQVLGQSMDVSYVDLVRRVGKEVSLQLRLD